MTNISLRAYHRKIEHLLEDHLTEQALFHCRSLLEEFPKSHHTYQLASRALLDIGDLEATESGLDILLQINPDDFVAHLGKSVIAESRNLLDDAVAHMKQAFEIQPANEGLQGEVRRLLEKKDTVSPNKLVLTRGALIKMYMRGRLYDQAIGEIMIGLNESPHRIDFQLALAESLMATGKSIQAVEICLEITKRLPFCLRANEILLQSSMQEPRGEGNNIYQSRLIELDPYYAYMLPTTQSVLDVPDIAVMLEEKTIPEEMEKATDWRVFLDQQWNLPATIENEKEANLDEVIQKFADPSFGNPFPDMLIPDNQDGKMERVELEETNLKQNDMTEEILSRRNAFINKLRRYPDETHSAAGFSTEIDEIGFDQTVQETQEPKEIPLEVGIPNNESITPDSDEEESAKPPAELRAELEGSIWETGEEQDHEIKTTTADENEKTTIKLNDTQPIQVTPNDPEMIMQEAEKAINGGNFQYALNLIRPLIEKNLHLASVCHFLESAVDQHPEQISFLLLLGEVYTHMENREKALSVFQKAQNLIYL